MKLTIRALGASQLNSGVVRCLTDGFSCARMMCAFIAVLLVLAVPVMAAGPCGLTDDQMQKLKAIAMETRDDIETQRQTLKRARTDLASVYRVYNLDDARARVLIGKISKAQKELLDELLENQVKIRQILNAEQFAAFDKMIKSRMNGMDMMFASPILPIEEEALEEGLSSRLKDDRPREQEKYAQMVKWIAKKKPEALKRLRNTSHQLALVYSDYDLDSTAARKLIDAVHRDQIGLTWMMHKRQQAVRRMFTEEQFNQLQQEASAKTKDANFLKRHRSGRPR